MADEADAAFLGLLARHAPAIARVCRHYEAAPDLRRDLEQEVLLALWRAQQTFRGDCSERTWVYRVAHNVGTTHVMRATRPNARSSRSDGQLDSQAEARCRGEGAATDAARPDVAAEHRDRLSRLEAKIRGLDLTGQQLVLLALEGCSTKEIAEVTGLRPTNVTTRLSRLRKALVDDAPGEEGA